MVFDTLVVVRGLGLGFAVAATFGPIGALCLRRTLASGVFLGFAARWLLLASCAARARERIGPRAMRWINLAAGLLIAAFGVLALAAQLRLDR